MAMSPGAPYAGMCNYQLVEPIIEKKFKWLVENVRCLTVLNSKIFYHHIIANWPQNATQIKTILNKRTQIGFFERKTIGFF